MNQHIETLDNIFSEYVRLRDADQYGMIRCISCGKRVHWKQADAGHYVGRANMNLRYDGNNVNAQCVICNRFRSGNLKKYKRGLIIKYGRFIIDYLENKKSEVRQFSDYEIELLSSYYRKQVRLIKDKKGL